MLIAVYLNLYDYRLTLLPAGPLYMYIYGCQCIAF